MKKFFFLVCLVVINTWCAHAADTLYLKVHFLYGSKPLKKYSATEPKWFGGILGGHVGIEGKKDRILNFVPNGKFHWFAKKKDKHSQYLEHSFNGFYSLFGGDPDSMKRAIVYVPVTVQQQQKFDSLSAAYLAQTPYDYALFGMRCGAAAYEILGQVEVLPSWNYGKTYRKIFYPQKLRKRLFKKAKENGWKIEMQKGTVRRKWERD